jgi:ribosomal protein S21
MLIIKVESNNIEKALKQYKSKVIRTKQIKKLREGTEYVKDSVLKRKQLIKAKYIQAKNTDQNK